MTSRRVLITGASRGIGRSVAEQLAVAGHRPVGIARRAPASFPGEFHVADLADRSGTAAVLEAILADGPVDAVVNNVGMVRLAPLGSIALDDLGELFDVNVRVAVQVAQAVLPGMRAAGWGRIVNVTSMVALGTPERTAYGAAKAALEACTRVWAKELGPTGITVNAVAPGPTETELFRSNTPPGSAAEARYLAGIAVDRLGTPQELAAAICFLLSEDAGFITGQTVRVDGGGSLAAA
jgi:NAD(P)-dependent dehydrogenase (short-subunit alcohol dehydrogenase family)